MFAILLMLQSTDIVITGKRLVEAQAACVRGGCTPLRDAQTSIALAEAQFHDGNYLGARDTLAAAVARNRNAAATDPKPVAALYEAYATVELHEGDRQIYRRAVTGRVATLRDNLPPGDPAVVAATGALGDMWVNLSNYSQAIASYRAAEASALADGQERAAILVGMKRVALIASRDRRKARHVLDELGTRPIAQEGAYRTALDVLRLRIAARSADEAEISRLVARVGHRQGTPPTLIYAPPYRLDVRAASNQDERKFGLSDAIRSRSNEMNEIRWADIGFWIRPDGRTDDIDVLRGNGAASWIAPAIAQIEARRYTAATSPTADSLVDSGGSASPSGSYRVERFTSRSDYATPTDSNIRRRTAVGRV